MVPESPSSSRTGPHQHIAMTANRLGDTIPTITRVHAVAMLGKLIKSMDQSFPDNQIDGQSVKLGLAHANPNSVKIIKRKLAGIDIVLHRIHLKLWSFAEDASLTYLGHLHIQWAKIEYNFILTISLKIRQDLVQIADQDLKVGKVEIVISSILVAEKDMFVVSGWRRG